MDVAHTLIYNKHEPIIFLKKYYFSNLKNIKILFISLEITKNIYMKEQKCS